MKTKKIIKFKNLIQYFENNFFYLKFNFVYLKIFEQAKYLKRELHKNLVHLKKMEIQKSMLNNQKTQKLELSNRRTKINLNQKIKLK